MGTPYPSPNPSHVPPPLVESVAGKRGAFVHLGNIAVRRGDIEGAIHEFERALDVDPSMDPRMEKIDELRGLGDR
jgi:Tfp pilus assembly protein PilF